MGVADAIKKMFKARSLTQTDVAEKIGKNQSSVAMYLKSADSMRIDNLMKLADVCGYDIALVSRDGKCDDIVLGENERVLKGSDDAKMYELFRKWYEETQRGGEEK